MPSKLNICIGKGPAKKSSWPLRGVRGKDLSTKNKILFKRIFFLSGKVLTPPLSGQELFLPVPYQCIYSI